MPEQVALPFRPTAKERAEWRRQRRARIDAAKDLNRRAGAVLDEAWALIQDMRWVDPVAQIQVNNALYDARAAFAAIVADAEGTPSEPV